MNRTYIIGIVGSLFFIFFLAFFTSSDISRNIFTNKNNFLAQVSGTVTPPYIDSNGWTVFTPSSDTQKIYVSNSMGNDTNNGLSESTPVKTISKGLSLLRNGFPDWLLLKKGDTWTDETFGQLCRSGRSGAEPLLLSSYGTGPRPLIKTKPSVNSGGIDTNGGGGCTGRGVFFALVGIEFYAYTRDPNSPNFNASTLAISHSGFALRNATSWMLLEDNKFSFYKGNDIQGKELNPFNNVSLRRNIITDDYSTDSHSQGIFSSYIYNFLLEENVWDHNGWNHQVAAMGFTMASSTIFNRNMYLSHGDGKTILRGNIDANGASGGAQVRAGGIVENNLFLRDPIAITFGSNQNPTISVSGVIRNNVILDARDIDSQVQGTGITLSSNELSAGGGQSYITNLEVYGNIFAHQEHGTGNIAAIKMIGNGPFINTNIHDNLIYNWSRPVYPNPNDHRASGFLIDIVATSTNTTFHDNIIQQPNSGFIGWTSNCDTKASGISRQNNTYWSAEVDPPIIWSKGWFQWSCGGGSTSWDSWMTRTGEIGAVKKLVNFPDPNRTIDTYMTSLGMSGGYDAFMARARSQSKDSWDPHFTAYAVNDYVRAGFGKALLSPPISTLPLPPISTPTPTPTPTPISNPIPSSTQTPTANTYTPPSYSNSNSSNINISLPGEKRIKDYVKSHYDSNKTCVGLSKDDDYSNCISYALNPDITWIVYTPTVVAIPNFSTENTIIISAAVPNTSVGSAVSSATNKKLIVRNLQRGMFGEDVRNLQKFLNRRSFPISIIGPGSLGNETAYFGIGTKKAVILFQNTYRNEILAPSGLSQGNGFVGPATRAKINRIIEKEGL